MTKCRCGHRGIDEHPCHAKGYTCGKPAMIRFYNTKIVSLAGRQMKLEVMDTWACDECWAEFIKNMKILPISSYNNVEQKGLN